VIASHLGGLGLFPGQSVIYGGQNGIGTGFSLEYISLSLPVVILLLLRTCLSPPIDV
jgi:hypothetical protein